MFKSLFKRREKALERNHDHHFNSTLRALRREYEEAYEEIDDEIIKWYKNMDDIKASNPNFKFSELKHLEELIKQIKLILRELSRLEVELVETNLNQLYISDYMDLAKMNEEYRFISKSPMPEINQLASTQLLEAYMNLPQPNADTTEIVKNVEISWWYSPIKGKWFNTRIEERAEKLGYSIESKLKRAIIRGDGYDKVAGELMKDLDISFKSAKTLVATELRTAEIAAKIHNAKKNGYTHVQRKSMRDSHVCKLCQEMDGTIYPLDSVTAGDFMLHPNDRCVLLEVVVDENGKPKRSQFYDEVDEFIEQRMKEDAERARRIWEEHQLKEKEKKKKKK